HVDKSAFEQLIHPAEGVFATASRSEPITVLGKFTLKDRFYHHSRRGLHDAIRNRRDTQRSRFAAARFRDHDPFDRLGSVGPSFEVLSHGEQPFLAVFTKGAHSHAIHATGPGVGSHLFPCQSEGSLGDYFVNETEPHVSFHPSLKGHQHLLTPDAAFGLVALPQVLFTLLI